MTLGIVVYTMDNLDVSQAIKQSIVFDRISLVPNLFAVDANPQTYDQVLRECEFYFEKSYTNGVLPGTATTIGQRTYPLRISYVNGFLYLGSFGLVFNSVKRAAPKLNFYSPDGTADNLLAQALLNGADVAGSPVNEATTHWTETGKSIRSVYMLCNASDFSVVNANGAAGNEGVLNYQYTADARLGV